MNPLLLQLLDQFPHTTPAEADRALRQVLQQIALLGLWRAKFFEHGAFYGGTSLRILYGLDRFSEDLDFSLLQPTPDFDLSPYLRAIEDELSAFGVSASVEKKEKSKQTPIQSAFLKTGTLELLLHAGVTKAIHPHKQVKIRIEVDTDPPPLFETEETYLFQPIPFSIRTLAKPDLFAGKLHALLCREWKTRVKGRDWWDFVWFVAQGIPLHIEHLEARMRQTGHYRKQAPLTEREMRQVLDHKIDQVDLEQAKMDLLPFIQDPSRLDVWTPEFFHALAKQMVV